VGGKAPNGFGLHDMSGNVFEWVNDWYSSGYYASSPSTNPSGPTSGSDRVLRGGSWGSGAGLLRSSSRAFGTPGDAYDSGGFRVARATDESPALASVSPASGPTTGRTTITLTGTNLTGATSVTVGGVAATGVTVLDATTVTAVTPAGTAGAKTVSVTTPGGTANLANGFTYVVPAPTLASVAPTSGPPTGGTTITLTGTNLTGATSVTVGGVAATGVTVVNATTVTAVTPAGTAGARDVAVTTPGGTAAAAGAFSYATVPSWATLLEAQPDPAIVTSASLRAAIVATGRPWRVRDNLTQIEMVLIPPGTFNMGCSASGQFRCDPDEFPVHAVTLTNAFYLGRYEVTQAQWTARMGSNPSFFQSASAQVPAAQVPNRPVETVSWNTIQGFLSATGMRLPTEAEWEYAYRAGTTTAFHGWPAQTAGTNDDTLVGNIAWFSSNSNSQTRPVGGKAPNGFGLHDMAGNVWEWVNDWWSEFYYASSPSTNPPGPASGSARVVRGGSWFGGAFTQRSSNRNSSAPGSTGSTGFRVARAP
jgi:formylglycine-generating enzyme required for sulfatase activity